jgi:hypothetical protein
MFVDFDCDFCGGATSFIRVYDEWGVSSWLEGVNGCGSDYLAIWCGVCGPKHREREAVIAK